MNVGPALAETAVLSMQLEVAFLTLPVAPNEGTIFLRINLQKMAGLTPNSVYTVTHPFGTFNFTTDALGDTQGPGGQAFRSEEGCFDAPCTVFTDLLAATITNIGPFLKAVNPPPPAGYIGDPNITQTVTGGTNGNIFRIDGPNIGGTGVDTVETNLWSLAGKVFSGRLPTPLIVERTTYNRATGGAVEVFTRSAATATVRVTGGPNLPATALLLAKDANGNFYRRIQLPDASTLPPTVTLTATNTGNTKTVISSPLVDVVTITEADYDAQAQILTINAVSSDQSPSTPPTLTAVGYGPLVNGAISVPFVTIPPAYVTVTSSAGGTATLPVTICPLMISGKVLKEGVGAPGVTVTLSGAHDGVTVTDINGKYTFPNLMNGDYIVTPSLTNFSFNPAATAVTLSGLSVYSVNFAMSGLQIFGVIKTAAGVAMPGVTVTLSGAASATTTTNANGQYRFNVLPDNSTFTITPSDGVSVFTPLSRTVTTAGANITGQGFTGN
jgi:hypothetical protein